MFIFPSVGRANIHLPTERIGEIQHKEQNKDINLFQDKEIYDLKIERKQKETKEFNGLFLEDNRKQNNQKELFQNEVKIGTEGEKVQEHGHSWYLLFFPLIGLVISIVVYWRNMR